MLHLCFPTSRGSQLSNVTSRVVPAAKVAVHRLEQKLGRHAENWGWSLPYYKCAGQPEHNLHQSHVTYELPVYVDREFFLESKWISPASMHVCYTKLRTFVLRDWRRCSGRSHC